MIFSSTLGCSLAACSLALGAQVMAAEPKPQILYQTQFEPAEGYRLGFMLPGQENWTGEGSAGNGLTTLCFDAKGQQAFIGHQAPKNGEDTVSIWREVSFEPQNKLRSVLQFSVLMEIVDSTNGRYDDFRWSFYNLDGHRLFSLDFDNSAQTINYVLDGKTEFKHSGYSFTHQGGYELVIMMNFGRNVWTAAINGKVIIPALPITRTGAALDLGEIGAVWSIRDPARPGDNYMAFDDLEVVHQPVAFIPPVLEVLPYTLTGDYRMRVYGEPGLRYAVEHSSNLLHWQEFKSGQANSLGTVELSDSEAGRNLFRFYRVKELP